MLPMLIPAVCGPDACPQFEPWHMITSFVQYLLMAPSYISVLNVYAVSMLFCFSKHVFPV